MISFVYVFLFFELSKNHQNIWKDVSDSSSNFNLNILWIVLLLMPINWLIESIKWQFLIKKIERVKTWSAFQAVLAGTAISIFTPNRIGDYLGRIFILKKGDRLDGTVATIIGNISQLFITLIMGSFGIFYFMNEIIEQFFQIDMIYGQILRILIIVIDIAIIYTFFKFPVIEKALNENFEIYKYPILRHLNLLSEYNVDELLKVMALSLLRFLVYSFQFYLLFMAFNISLDFIEGMLVVFLIFFGITLVPSIAVAELGIRGIITLFIFNVLWTDSFNMSEIETMLVSATSLLWLINIAIPAIIGGLFIFKLRFFRKSDEIPSSINIDK